jgi:hypothetical protein
MKFKLEKDEFVISFNFVMKFHSLMIFLLNNEKIWSIFLKNLYKKVKFSPNLDPKTT